jgi:hypothetical protein
MRNYMRKRRAAGQPSAGVAAQTSFRLNGAAAAPARPSPQLARDRLRATGPLHADFVADHNRTGGQLRPAIASASLWAAYHWGKPETAADPQQPPSTSALWGDIFGGFGRGVPIITVAVFV